MAVEVPMKKLRYYWPVYLLIAVPLIMVCVFSYFPIYNGFVHIFYRWNGDTVEEFIGLGNIMRVLQDATLLHSFGVVLIFVSDPGYARFICRRRLCKWSGRRRPSRCCSWCR